MNYYDVLGVSREAEADELHRAYQRRLHLVHPDRHLGGSPEVLAEAHRMTMALTEAWEVLGDPARRRWYDRSLRLQRRRRGDFVVDVTGDWSPEDWWSGAARS